MSEPYYFSNEEEVPVGSLMVKNEPEMEYRQAQLHYNQFIQRQPLGIANLPPQAMMRASFDALHNGEMEGGVSGDPLLGIASPEPSIDELLFPDLNNQPPQFVEQYEHKMMVSAIDESENPTPPNIGDPQAVVEVNLCHKPRGCKGVWQLVGNRDALRVTKGKGKWLKLEIKSPYEFKSSDVDIYLVDMSGNSPMEMYHNEEEGFVIESSMEAFQQPQGLHVVDVELKLDRVCKKLQFFVKVKTPSGFLSGKSVEFGAHNNGKARKETHSDEGTSPSEYDSSPTGPHDLVPVPINQTPLYPLDAKNLHMHPLSDQKMDPQKKRKRANGTQPSPPTEEEIELPSSVVPGSLRVHGVVRAKAFLQFSDLRLKADIEDLTDAVNIVSQLKGKTFIWKNGQVEESGGKRVIGMIAQEVRRVVPNVVHEDENGYLSVAYAELVPILVEALKEHLRVYEHERGDVKHHMDELNIRLEKMQSVIDKAEVEREEMKQTPSVYTPPPFMMLPMGVSEKQRPLPTWRTHLLRVGIIFLFLLGLAGTIVGSIILGVTVSRPQQISVTVLEAAGLKGMDQDGAPDPYCEITLGRSVFRTSVVFNTPSPEFDETFSTVYDSSVFVVSFAMYDKNQYYSDVEIGVASIANLSELKPGLWYEKWLTLSTDSSGGSTGSLKVAFYIDKPAQPGYELAILIVGAVLTLSGLVLGFYLWRTPATRPRLHAGRIL